MLIIETEAVLVKKEDLSSDTRLFTFKPKTAMNFIAGQFISINLDKKEKALSRAFSIASSPKKENTLEFCIKIVPDGVVSPRLDALRQNATVLFKGPYGNFMLHTEEKEIVLIAGGTGIAPIRAILQQLAEKKSKIRCWLFYRFKNQEDFLFKEELTNLQKVLPNFKLIASLSNHTKEWHQETQRIHEVITKYIQDTKNKDVYVCGPPLMVKETIEALVHLGFDAAHIYKEAWG